jgi:hypothetical protein
MRILIYNTTSWGGFDAEHYKSKLKDFKYEEVRNESDRLRTYIEINSFEDFDSSHVYEFMNSLNYSAQTKSSIAFAIRNLFDMFQKQHESAWSVSVSVFEANRLDAIIVKICE